MKIIAISDTHDNHRQIKIPEADMLIVAGDFTCHREPIIARYSDFHNWITEQPVKYKIVVAGNHDTLFEKQNDLARQMFHNVTYLEDSGVEIEGLKIWGSPWTPEFAGWAFMKPDHELEERWQHIPRDIDILITHGGPYGILDENLEGQYCGSSSLLKRIHELRNLKYHIFGHIHEAKGKHNCEELSPTFINASQCDRLNNLVNKPVVINL